MTGPFVDLPEPLNINYLACFCSRLLHRSNVNGRVADMHLGPLDSFITRRIFRRLVRSAYTDSELRSFISETAFRAPASGRTKSGLKFDCIKQRELAGIIVAEQNWFGVRAFPIIL
jgi:hypothetical protein